MLRDPMKMRGAVSRLESIVGRINGDISNLQKLLGQYSGWIRQPEMQAVVQKTLNEVNSIAQTVSSI